MVFWHNNQLDPALEFAQKFGIKRSQWLDRALQAMEEPNGNLCGLLDNFVQETKAELFPTREACQEFYSGGENFQRLLVGEIGENLINKHNALATFYLWPAVCKLGMDVTRQLLVESGASQRVPDFDQFWDDFTIYTEAQHASGKTEEEVLSPQRIRLRYNIARWLADGSPIDPTGYRLLQPSEFELRLPPEAEDGMRAALKVWTTNVQGLAKLVTRINLGWLNRECRMDGEWMDTATVNFQTPLHVHSAAAGGH